MIRKMKRVVTISAVAGLFALAGCSASGPAPSGSALPTVPAPALPTTAPSAAMRTWYADGGAGDINVLTLDVKGITSDGGNRGRLHTDCLAMEEDLGKTESHAPIPDVRWEAAWKATLTTLRDGYWDCLGGFSGNNPSQVTKGAGEIESTTVTLRALGEELDA